MADFSGEVKGISSDLIKSLSAADAEQQLATSFDRSRELPQRVRADRLLGR